MQCACLVIGSSVRHCHLKILSTMLLPRAIIGCADCLRAELEPLWSIAQGQFVALVLDAFQKNQLCPQAKATKSCMWFLVHCSSHNARSLHIQSWQISKGDKQISFIFCRGSCWGGSGQCNGRHTPSCSGGNFQSCSRSCARQLASEKRLCWSMLRPLSSSLLAF